MSKEYKFHKGKLQLIETTEFDLEIVLKVLNYLFANSIIEFRGMADEVDGITKDDIYLMESFGLVEFVEYAWHPSWILNSDTECVKMINRELKLSQIVNEND